MAPRSASTSFNIAIMEILNMMLKKYPKNMTLYNLRAELQAVISLNAAAPFTIAAPMIQAWRTEIEAGNEDFFLTLEYDAPPPPKPGDTGPSIDKLIAELRTLWVNSLTPAERSVLREKARAIARLVPDAPVGVAN